jgi:rhodanese-related sulfurtransferase
MTDTNANASAVGRVSPADPDVAAAFFAARMACQTDVSDVHALIESDHPGVLLVDTRDHAAWEQGHISRAVHLPTDEIPRRAPGLLDRSKPVVTYCWGPGCNGATRAALALSQLGYQVREMIGGFEYWTREGFPVESGTDVTRRPVDPLTGPVAASRCHC